MSTEATGGGQPDADGAGEPEVAAEGTEPAATTLAAPTAWDTAAPSAWGPPAVASAGDADPGALVPEQPTAPDETAVQAGSDAVADELPVRAETSPVDEGDPSTTGGVQAAETGDPDLDKAVQRTDEPDKGDEPSETEEAREVHEPDVPAENDEPGETESSAEDREPAEVNEAAEAREPGEADHRDDAGEYDEHVEYDEHDEHYDGYADGEAAAGGEEDEEEEYDPGEADGPQRARRWPRVLLALGFVVLAAVIVGGAIAIVGSVTHGFKKPVKITYKESALFSLKTGECFNPQGQSYSLISCGSPHQAEVFATFTLSGTQYPGATAIATQASDGCTSRLTGYVNPQLALSLTSTYVYPDSVAWQAGTRTVICEVRASDGTLTGSVRSASAS